MLVKCPFCGNRVLPTDQGGCPACLNRITGSHEFSQSGVCAYCGITQQDAQESPGPCQTTVSAARSAPTRARSGDLERRTGSTGVGRAGPPASPLRTLWAMVTLGLLAVLLGVFLFSGISPRPWHIFVMALMLYRGLSTLRRR